MPFQESTTSVGTTAVALGSNGLQGRARMIVFNAAGGGNLYVGSAGVTIARGIPIASNSSYEFAAPDGQTVYAIGNQGTSTARVIEIG